MAIKFKGDTTVAIINSIKKAEVDTVYRCFDSGVLLSNEVINHGDFVSWDGTKWIKRPDLSYLIIAETDAVVLVSKPQSFDSTQKAQGRANIGAVSAADVELAILSYASLAANTLRFSFSKLDYDPTVAGVGSTGTWTKVSTKLNNVWDWTRNNINFYKAFERAFTSSDNLVSVIAAGDTSVVTNMGYMFSGCSSLASIPLFDTSAVTNTGYMFSGCTSLTSVPLFNTSAVTSMRYMFAGCSSLTSIPLFDTSKVSDASSAFNGCVKVEGGALALYQQMSAQATPPINTSNCFSYCGKDTATGAAELAQIPASWGGTAP